MRKNSRKGKASSNTLRIIGGNWRSRKLNFISVEGLRPTPDRVRETLFNWLQADIANARCLDLFAGSGALGLEAFSRGASSVVFVEKHRAVAKQLGQNLVLLNAECNVENTDAESYLSKAGEFFDIIFLDPPFRKNYLPKILDGIIKQSLLKPSGLIYLEHEAEEGYNWQKWGLVELKSTQAGQVKSTLLSYK
ncbi:MAG TPA: 16S rRNA (guanine(966)-N(2))-methyltransferase RsmD [Leucothrix mucor]|nr:16S rRNA (guanine(966)-N(2))-methyltransferase RsmD [Leucothrix mucor]